LANPNGIEDWLIRNADLFNIQIERAHWAHSLIPGLHDINLKIEYEGREFSGSGSSVDERVALHRAFSEAIERIVFQEHSFPTTNGMAAHINADLAAKAASQELFERDLFLCHFLTKTPFPRSEISLQPFPGLEAWANRTRIKFSCFKLGSLGSICLADGRNANDPFGFVISSAYKNKFLESNESAIISTARWAHRIYTKSFVHDSISLPEFEKIKNPSLLDHGRLARDIDYANRISHLFETDIATIGADFFPPMEFNFFRPFNTGFFDCPIHVARATSENAQNLFVGKLSLENINLARLESFAGRNIEWNDLNQLPHPIN
jgi:hypothetical protein